VSLTLICHCLERIGTEGQVYDTFSSDLRGVSEESFTSTENGTSLSFCTLSPGGSVLAPPWWGQFNL
jgi:hypothetical protein